MFEGTLELLPHHEQLPVCDTRLPYRQGRTLTAVKVYSINNESRHLLVFGVPSLNLRQETKALFSRFGRLQFNTTTYPAEKFTETFHAVFEDIQSARIAKKMLDTKNFYGGNLHICYAPELENLNDTRQKLLLRQKSVVNRLRNLEKSTEKTTLGAPVTNPENIDEKDVIDNKIYMGNENTIGIKRKTTDYKSVKHCKLKKSRIFDRKCVAVTNNDLVGKESDGKKLSTVVNNLPSVISSLPTVNHSLPSVNNNLPTVNDNLPTVSDSLPTVSNILPVTDCETIDFTSADTEILTNINESLNYNKFGQELIKQVPFKPVNKIKFNFNINK